MTIPGLTFDLRRFFDIRPGEVRRVAYMAALLFFLLAANNVIKIVRDALFLSRFPITQLPYVFLLAALVAGVVIAIYSRYTGKVPLTRLLLGSLAFITSNVILFWLVLTFYNAGWILYAYYIWSAMVGLILVAQFWTFANELFTPRDGKRLFGVITAGGTVGGLMGGVVSNWAVRFLFGTNHLLWLIVALFLGAFGVVCLALKERDRLVAPNDRADGTAKDGEAPDVGGVVSTIMQSSYLQTIAAVIFVSVIVSTLIDYQFKAWAKLTYTSADALAGFFGSYYAWLSVVTMVAQLWLTRKLLIGLGLAPSLLVLPASLLAGLLSALAWPGLLTATATRLAETSLRTSVNQSSVQILYLPIADSIKKKVKVFTDVTVERLGDAVAATIILSYSFLGGGSETTALSYFAIGFVVIWVTLIFAARLGYVDTLRNSLAYRDIPIENTRIDFADKATVETVLKILDRPDEKSVLFGLDLAEKLGPTLNLSRLPRALLRHPSPEVRRRALTLFAEVPDPNILGEVFELLASGSAEIQSEAIKLLGSIKQSASIPIIRPFLDSPEPQVRRAAIQCILQNGDAQSRLDALNAFRRLLVERDPKGEPSRVEAARLMGEMDEPEFFSHLRSLITGDPAPAVVRAAMVAAGRRQDPLLIEAIVTRLGSSATKDAAREALVRYGEMAIKGLRAALFDNRVLHEIRLNIPRTLSKIHAQSAMNALLGGLLDEDRSIRFKVIVALEEMSRRFSDLKVDRDIVESAIISDALLYAQRFVIFSAIFGHPEKPFDHGASLLYFALTDSMERVKERVMWLLGLIYPAKDIQRSWAGLSSKNPIQRAHAVEFLDNMLAGNVKRYVFPLVSDAPPAQLAKSFESFLGNKRTNPDSALSALLKQEDIWLAAAAVWEIGMRRLSGFRDKILELKNSDHVVLREAAELTSQRI
ncbi:MAG TPA: Npt1/Npt2 family nucleotide transporter [Candidatus Binatia bacterium]|nr:Npt1/Npt2 family nucleotide transporter [Candidatus Binatia bacterium]